MANRLIDETSPYLLQHAHNPVDWYPWGTEAFLAAREHDRPILLSIGYSACHWCHVMERESFEDPTVAARMNTFFVNVKVDREERPDVDELYMRAVQAFNEGRGGWPMTVFLTPTGEPFFGGSYFPPVAQGGLPGFVDILEHVRGLWNRRREDVESLTTEMVALLERSGAMPVPGEVLVREWMDPVVRSAAEDFDVVNGGFGDAPKFPPHGTLSVLMAHHLRTGEEASLRMVVATLDAMARGGMYDLLAGGFARYSVDAEWRVPHFEKMLYDNGQLLAVYVDAFKLTGRPQFARVIRETVGWLLRELRLDHGGFAASLDADSQGAEGRFFVWTPEELTGVLGAQGAAVAALLQVTEEGTFEHGTSVLRLHTALEEHSEADRALLQAALPKLMDARATREAPARDDKAVASWNAMAIASLARAGTALGEPGWITAAEDAARFLLEHNVREGRLMRSFKDGHARVPAYADDYAQLIGALLDLWEATFDPAWLDAANDQADRFIALFWDEEDGGVFLTGSDQPALVAQSKPFVSSAEPAANGVAALAFVRLAVLCGRDDLSARAEQIIRASQRLLSRAPRAISADTLAGAWHTGGGLEIAVVGPPDDPRTVALLAQVRLRYLPFAALFSGPEPDPIRMPWLAGKDALGGIPTAYVCERGACQLPLHDPVALGALLDERSGGRPADVRDAAPAARPLAPAFPAGAGPWLGAELLLELSALRGSVVILHFWTYSRTHSAHMLPELAHVAERFGGDPVVVIGVHTPKFPAEEQQGSVRVGMARLDVGHPVVQDTQRLIWNAYGVQSWPTVVVIDTQGRIAMHQAGESGRDLLGGTVEELLQEARTEETLASRRPMIGSPTVFGSDDLSFPGKVHVWPDSWDQELGGDPFTDGRMYVADTGHHRILECRLGRGAHGWPTATLVRTIGSGVAGLQDGPPGQVQFRSPQGLRRHMDVLYVADAGNHALRAVDLTSGGVATLAGTGEMGDAPPTADALQEPLTVSLRSPWDVEVMSFKHHHLVFIAMAGSNQVWVYGNGHLGLYAGSGREDHVDGVSSLSALAEPKGLALYGRYLLFADSQISSVRAVDMQSHQLVTVVGRGPFDFGDVDGAADDVRLQQPTGVTFLGENLYVTDTLNNKVKRIGLGSGETQTIAGGETTALWEPSGIARAGEFLIIADTNNHRLRALNIETGELRDLPIDGLIPPRGGPIAG